MIYTIDYCVLDTVFVMCHRTFYGVGTLNNYIIIIIIIIIIMGSISQRHAGCSFSESGLHLEVRGQRDTEMMIIIIGSFSQHHVFAGCSFSESGLHLRNQRTQISYCSVARHYVSPPELPPVAPYSGLFWN